MTTRCTIDQAAARLGVSRPTIRRRLRNGQLRGERRSTPQGFVWEVLLDSPPDSPAEESPAESPTPPPTPQAMPPADGAAAFAATEGARLRDEHIADLRRRVEDQAREIAELHRLLAQAQAQTQRLLTDSLGAAAPRESGDSPSAESPTPQTQQDTAPRVEERRLPWWKRLFAATAVGA